MEIEKSQVNRLWFFPLLFPVTLIFPKSEELKKKREKEIINYLKMLYKKKKSFEA